MMITYGIYSLTPSPSGDDHRFIEVFLNRKDAQKVLDVLESVDTTKFHTYKIIELEVK